jgi:hypothetical protein
METINTTELKDETVFPDEQVLRQVLGASFEAYTAMLDMFVRRELIPEWRYYRDGKAWLCKVQKKKRTILWMSAWKGYMQAAIYFPEKYWEEVSRSELEPEHLARFSQTRPVGRSRPFIFEVKTGGVVLQLEKAVELKLRCR